MNFSFIMLHYNQYGEVKTQALKSIKEAMDGYFDYEVVIIDDSSDEDEYVSLKTLECDNVKVLQCPVRKNQSIARNIGVDASTGDYVWYIDGDDWYSITGLRNACSFIMANPNYDMYSSKVTKPRGHGGPSYITSILSNLASHRTVTGTMQYCVPRKYIESSGIVWDEEVYYWDSEDFYYYGLLCGMTTNILQIDIEGPIAYHPLYDDSNSDRVGDALPPYYLYMIGMSKAVYAQITNENIKHAISFTYLRQIDNYKRAVKYDSSPKEVRDLIDAKIARIPGEEIPTNA